MGYNVGKLVSEDFRAQYTNIVFLEARAM